MVEATVQLGGDIARETEEVNRGVEEAYGLKEMWRRGISFSAVIHVDENNPIYVILCRLTSRVYRRKDVIGDKRKCAGRKKFLEAMQERGASLNLLRLEPGFPSPNGR